MKKIFLSLILLTGSLGFFTSCSEDEKDPILETQNIVLSSPTGGTYVLTASNASSNAFTAKWSSSTFGYQASVKYYLQAIRSTVSNFDSPGEMLLGDYSVSDNVALEKTVTNRQFNVALLGANGSIGSSDSYKLRIVAKLIAQSSVSGVVAVSNVVTITATPYDTFDEFPRLYLPGSYGAASTYADWSASGNSGRIFSAASDGNYEGFVWMNVSNPEFKFNSDPTWSGNDKGEANGSGAFSGNLGGNNIKPADGAGTYFFTVNWAGLTYTMEKRHVVLIGAAVAGTGWSTPVDLDFDTNPSSPYYRMYTKDVTLVSDEFLIRLKDDWSVKMGTMSGNNGDLLANSVQNKIKLGGGNMKAPSAGNFKVVLDIRNSANYNIRLMPI